MFSSLLSILHTLFSILSIPSFSILLSLIPYSRHFFYHILYSVFGTPPFIFIPPTSFSMLYSPYSALHTPYSTLLLQAPLYNSLSIFYVIHSSFPTVHSPFSTIHFTTRFSIFHILLFPFFYFHSSYSILNIPSPSPVFYC